MTVEDTERAMYLRDSGRRIKIIGDSTACKWFEIDIDEKLSPDLVCTPRGKRSGNRSGSDGQSLQLDG